MNRRERHSFFCARIENVNFFFFFINFGFIFCDFVQIFRFFALLRPRGESY